jgi:recombination protein RecT
MTTQLTIKDRLSGDSFKEEVAKALPKHLTPERFIRVALTALNRVPKLQQCTQPSLFKCLLDCSSLGIEPDGRRAYLIPYGQECTLIISYMGLIELCKRNGDVSNVYAALVHENDFFEYDLGTERQITHKPVLKDRGEILGGYSVVSFKNGERDFEFMDIDEINAIRDRSKAVSSGPWKTDWGEMAKKTVIRRLLKRQILSPEIRDQIEKEDTYEAQSYQQKAAKAKPADQNPFVEIEATTEEEGAVGEPDTTEPSKSESEAQEYLDSLGKEGESE